MSFRLDRLYELMQERGLNKTKFLQATKLGKNQFSFWESGKTPTQSTLTLIANYLDVDIAYLTGESDSRNRDELIYQEELAIENVTEWLEDYGIELDGYDDDNGVGQEWVLSYNGKSINYQDHEFKALCVRLYKQSKSAEHLVIKEWATSLFGKEEVTLSEKELLLVNAYREATAQGKLHIIQVCMNERDAAVAVKGESINAG
ncbi:MAG: helix-turn-helix domain-containing protein [Clostridia bacterium]|nr:helix-turn-helix domain-containing protein [Clostridia bacterium]